MKWNEYVNILWSGIDSHRLISPINGWTQYKIKEDWSRKGGVIGEVILHQLILDSISSEIHFILAWSLMLIVFDWLQFIHRIRINIRIDIVRYRYLKLCYLVTIILAIRFSLILQMEHLGGIFLCNRYFIIYIREVRTLYVPTIAIFD